MRMPDLATTGSPMKVVRLLAAAGDDIARGQPILEVETDKATMEVESTISGQLVGLLVREGDEVLAGAPIATFSTDSAAGPEEVSSPPIAPVAIAPASPIPRPATVSHAGAGRTSFFARNRDRKAIPAPADGRDSLPLSLAERVVARRMQEIKSTVPHFYVQSSADAGRMVARRNSSEGPKPAWDAFFVIAAARALREHPRFAHRFAGDRLEPHGENAVGVAVDHEGELFTIRVEDPGGKDLDRVSEEIRSQVERIRSGDQKARQPSPASMTVSNLGGSRVESFAAIVNAPEASILAVGTIAAAAVVEKGRVVVQDRVNLTLSVDHRVASGRAAAAFLGSIVRELESF